IGHTPLGSQDPEKAAELVGTAGVTLRAFLGYAGWERGQLERELKHDTWLVTAVEGEILGKSDGTALWRQILGGIDPELKLLAEEPEDPTVN
ncbi:MAG TPA: YqgE/AlgH family protein, partial [Lacunisphaera sp.]|nr:YqgE/AlgH family protein [Lacunisphaera sp.]